MLINTIPDSEHEVYNRLSQEPSVIELHPLFWEYDIIAKIEADSHQKIGRFVSNKIRSIGGVIDTKILQ